MRLIATCNCDDTNQYAKDAFRILFPLMPKSMYPKLIKPTNEFLKVIRTHIQCYKGWSYKFKDRYAYYINNEDYNGDMVIYDLLTGEKYAGDFSVSLCECGNESSNED